jgi:hypothetical protein
VQATPPATTPATTATVTPPSDERTYRRSGRNRQAQMYRQSQMHHHLYHWPHYRGRITVGQVVAALHRYGIYW